MRVPVALLLIVTAGSLVSEARAEAPNYTNVRGEPSLTRQLILERAMYRARQRTQRIEARRWLGISLQRPSDTTGFGSTNAYQYRQPSYLYYPPGAGFWNGPRRN